MSTSEPEQNFLDPLDPAEPKVFEAPAPEREDATEMEGFDPFWEEGGDLPGALEALFTAAGEVLDIPKLRELTGFPEGALRQAIEKLQERLQPPRGLRLIEVGGGWRMATSPLYTELVSRMVTTVRSGRLTPAQLEALSIIAYRQPVTQPEINQIRGVSSSATQIKSLLERDLIVTAGRKPVVGRPMMYATTQAFLVHFGLKNLHDLPQLADFGEGKLEAQALLALEPPMPEDGLFGAGSEALPPGEAPEPEEAPAPEGGEAE
ncbi:MAG TPA: SMC-Scp complex subunit ScpB [Holophagaceae bacterium]|nr:SMC-Scp complex subunit ScpB [Holophagaceae bacterium]